MAAARCPPRSEPQNSHDFLPKAIPLSARSAALFERQARPSSRNRVKGVPAFEDVIDGLGEIMAPAEFGALLAHVDQQPVDERLALRLTNDLAFIGRFAVNGPLDLEQRVDAAHDLDRNRREGDFSLARGPSSRVFIEIGHDEERTSCMHPAARLDDASGAAAGHIELA